MAVWYAPTISALAALEEATTGMGQFMFPGRPGQDAMAHASRLETRFSQPAQSTFASQWSNLFAPAQRSQVHAMMQQQAPDWRQAYQVIGPTAGYGGWATAGTTRRGVPNKQMQQAVVAAQQAAGAAIQQNRGAPVNEVAAKAGDLARANALASGRTPAQANDAAAAAGKAVQAQWETAGSATQARWSGSQPLPQLGPMTVPGFPFGGRQVPISAPTMRVADEDEGVGRRIGV